MPISGDLRTASLCASCLAAVATLSACAPAIDTTRPFFAFSEGWQNTKSVGSRRFDEEQWWRGLNDPVLDKLITTALLGSPNLGAAQLRAQAARQEIGVLRDRLTISPDGEVTTSDGEFSVADRIQRSGVQYNFDFDLGRARDAERFGAIAQASVADAEEAAARLLLIGEVSEAYLALRHAQARIANIDRAVARQQKAVDISADLEKEGEVSRIGGLRGKARLQSLKAERLSAVSEIEIQHVRLAILAGAKPGALPQDIAAALHDRKSQPQPRLAPDPKVPADLVRNRPDLRIAEGNYNAARAALGSARAALYPSLALTGLIDTRDARLGSNTQSGDLRTLGLSIRLPALPLRATKAAAAAAETRVEASYKAWTASVLVALSEVETALLQYGTTVRVQSALDSSIRLNQEAYTLLLEATKEGEASLADLADLEAELFDAESRQIDARRDRALSFVNLNLRVGTGSSPSKS